MERGKKKKLIFVISILAILILIGAFYFTFIFHYSCDNNNMACFRAYQEKCIKATIINEADGIIWKYTIQGKKDNMCKISAEVIKLTSGDIDKKVLEDKSMDCYLNIGSLALPDSDINKCHGLLKEELQALIINQLHAYIVSNVKNIGSELAEIVDGTSTA